MCKAIIGTLSVEFVSDVSLKIHQITKDSTIVKYLSRQIRYVHINMCDF